MDRSKAARPLGQRPKRKRYTRTCPVCGREFATTERGIYCSARCQWRAASRRKRAAMDAPDVGHAAVTAAHGEGGTVVA
ncbi:MAG: hypothetical protein IRY83_02415 [Chloroflexi bacterium]|nr:hypothetical protein [Chloroflexota bacterium]